MKPAKECLVEYETEWRKWRRNSLRKDKYEPKPHQYGLITPGEEFVAAQIRKVVVGELEAEKETKPF